MEHAKTCILISYDLKKVKNYPKLYECLNQWQAQRLLESLWVANLRGPASAIRQMLANYIDGDDAIVVIELQPGIDWAALNGRPAGIALLQALGPVRAA
jgi:hypothetical protein